MTMDTSLHRLRRYTFGKLILSAEDNRIVGYPYCLRPRPRGISGPTYISIYVTSVFWPRVRARVLRAPVFFGSINLPKGALRAPPSIAVSLLLIHPPEIKITYFFSETNCLLSYAVPYFELRCTLLSYAAP
jgi:hypothetical protein